MKIRDLEGILLGNINIYVDLGNDILPSIYNGRFFDIHPSFLDKEIVFISAKRKDLISIQVKIS